LVELNAQGHPEEVIQLCVDGRNIHFYPQQEATRWE
jgi:hypothetical protein